jgi:hypothetical protein
VQLGPPATVLIIPWPLNGAAAMANATAQSTKRILIYPLSVMPHERDAKRRMQLSNMVTQIAAGG